MPASKKSKVLNSVGRVASDLLKKFKDKARPTAPPPPPSADDIALKSYVSSINTSSSSTSNPPDTQLSKSSKPERLRDIYLGTLKLHSAADFFKDKCPRQLTMDITSMLCGDSDYEDSIDDPTEGQFINVPWLESLVGNKISSRRKETCREKKQKWVFKKGQVDRFNRLVKRCGQQMGVDSTISLFGKMCRETGLKEYQALLALCIDKARLADDEEVQLDQNYQAYQLFKSMTEMGFPIEEDTYGPFLNYLIDFGMVQEFYFFADVFRRENPVSQSRLAYYEMLLCIRLENDEKIQELIYDYSLYDGEDKFSYQENYLLALCESSHRRELIMLLETFDVTKVSSAEHLSDIFKSLGMLLLESYMEKFMLDLKNSGAEAACMSNLLYNYMIGIPNLVVEDFVSKFKQLHSELEVKITSAQYEKLIKHACESLKVHVAIDILDEMLSGDLTLSLQTLHTILDACAESCDYNLVRRIYPMIHRHSMKPNSETFRSMMNLSVKMKDYEGAYNMLREMMEMDIYPTPGVYNAIMAGYFREKNMRGALMVLKQMQDADVKPDSQTFSYLIHNSNTEEDIIKIFDEMKHSGVQVTKHVFMALINAYAAHGQFEKAKQVILDKRIPVKYNSEMKSVLMSALASHGQLTDALNIYEELKQDARNLEPRAVTSLIEHLQSEGELDRLLQLLGELQDPDYWINGCCRVIAYCVRHKHLSSAISLLKNVKDKYCDDEVATENIFDEVFCQIVSDKPKDMQFGLDLLRAIKEELGLRPSRKTLDFLLSACVWAKDLKAAFFIWKEYQAADLPYNILTFVRMYQTLLALGDHKSAAEILNKIPKDDPHVCSVVKACQATYLESGFHDGSKPEKETNKKKKKKKRRKSEDMR